MNSPAKWVSRLRTAASKYMGGTSDSVISKPTTISRTMEGRLTLCLAAVTYEKRGLTHARVPYQSVLLHAEVRGLISTIDQLLLTLPFPQVSLGIYMAHLASQQPTWPNVACSGSTAALCIGTGRGMCVGIRLLSSINAGVLFSRLESHSCPPNLYAGQNVGARSACPHPTHANASLPRYCSWLH
jgi:hypothetical protein